MEDCKYNLILDNRENELIKIFRSCFSQVFVSQLDVGDIAICQMKDKSAKILAIFERKTVNDMLASLKDGRYKEQKIRLMSNHCQDKTKRIYYILEGDTNSLTKENDKKFWGAWISTQIRDGIQIIRTANISETVKFLIRLLERTIKDGPDMFEIPKYLKEYYGNKLKNKEICSNTTDNNNNNNDNDNDNTNDNINDEEKKISLSYLSTIKSKKKSNITPKLCQIMAISLTPNISNSIGEVVIEKYGSLVGLVDAYRKLELDNKDLNNTELIKLKKEMLANLKITEKRKLGKIASEKIYEFLFEC